MIEPTVTMREVVDYAQVRGEELLAERRGLRAGGRDSGARLAQMSGAMEELTRLVTWMTDKALDEIEKRLTNR
jgi:hypothetical protein